jgi:hypothetical protein
MVFQRRRDNFAVLGMALVKMVSEAGPKGKSLTQREMKLVSDPSAEPIDQDENDLAATATAQLHDRLIAR